MISARCLCKNYSLELQVPSSELPLKGSLCHCNSCRHGTGTLYIGAAYIPDSCLEPVRDSLSKLKASKWSDRRTMYFCDTCGTTVFGDLDDKLWFCTGALDKLEDIVHVERQIFVQDTKDGGFTNFLKTWDGEAVKTSATIDDDLPSDWPHTHQASSINPSDRLHGHCVCNGVNFWVSRPSSISGNFTNPWPDLLVPFHHTYAEPPDPKYPWWLCANNTKYLAGLCTCNSCRLASGSDVVQWAFIPSTSISFSPEPSTPVQLTHPIKHGTLKTYRSSSDATRYFCSGCGAHVFWIGDDRLEMVDGEQRVRLMDVAIGLLDADEGALAQHWLEWRTDRVSFREDAEQRAGKFVDHVEETLERWGQRLS